MSNYLTLQGRPDITNTPSGLRRITRSWKVQGTAAIAANIASQVFEAYGTADTEFTSAYLIEQRIERRAEQGIDLTLVKVYQELGSVLTATTEVVETTAFDGRRVTRTTYLCKAADAATLRPAIGSGSPAVFQVDVAIEGPVAKVVTSAIAITNAGFILSQSDDTKNNGKLLLRTIRTVGQAPGAQSGYTAIDTSTQQVDGYTVYTTNFAKGLGRIATDVAYKQNGKLKITTIRYLTTDDGAAVSGTLVNDDSQTQDGYTLYVKGYAEIVGDGIITNDVETKNNGKLRLYRIVRLGTAPNAPAASLSPTPGAIVATATDTRQEDGFTLYDYRWTEGYGRISVDVDTKEGGALVVSTVRFFATDDGATPAGTLITTGVAKQDGIDLTTKVYAAGIGEVSRESDKRLSGMLLRTTIRHLTATTVSTQPTSDPLSGGGITGETRVDQDGYRVWTVLWTKAVSTSFIVDSTEKRNKGKLVIYRRTKLGAAPAAPAATIAGTVVEIDSDEKLEDGYTVYSKTWAEGVGTVTDDVQSRNQGKLKVYHKVALGVAPTAPAATISGTVVLTQDDSREDNGVTIYDRTWAEGKGVIGKRTQARDGGLRLETWESLGQAYDASYMKPVGVLVAKDNDDLDGVTRWTVTCMQTKNGSDFSSDLGEVVDVEVTNGGGSYTTDPTVVFSDPPPGGTLATGTAVRTGNTVTGVTIVNAGSGYTSAPTITFTGGDGTEAAATATIDGAVGSNTAIQFKDHVEFVYPGRAKLFHVDGTYLSITRTTYDLFLAPPVEVQVLADVEISYTTDAEAIATLANALWNPSTSATVFANWIEAGTGTPKSRVEGLRGYRSVDDTEITITSGAGAYDKSVLGQAMQPSSVAKVRVTGGPDEPDENTYTLRAKLDPAFVAFDGTQWFRRTIVFATIPVQEALPV